MNEEILLQVKPKYIWWIRALNKVCNPVGIVIFLMIFAYIGVPLLFLPDVLKESYGMSYICSISLIIIALCLFLALIINIAIFFDKKNFEVTNYKVYNDRIEFEEGFINHKYTTIQLKDIKEIHLEQNFFQRKAELGSIRFVTAANNSTTNTGVYFRDIENSKYVYAKVKEIHEKV